MQTAKAPLLTNTPQPTPGLDVQKTRLPNIIVVNVNLDVRKAPDEVALEWLVGSPRTCLFNSRYCSIYQHMQHIQLQSFYTSTRNPVILSPLAKKGPTKHQQLSDRAQMAAIHEMQQKWHTKSRILGRLVTGTCIPTRVSIRVYSLVPQHSYAKYGKSPCLIGTSST